ncbi:MAG: SDR family NAD(P)-dependent oxidoreductase [Candidatus Woesearchaeota archaeon]
MEVGFAINKMKLRSKVAIITGAGKGIGKAIAIEFAREHAKLILLDIDSKSTKEVVEQIKHLGGEAVFMKCDVTKNKQVKTCLNKAIKKFKKIDILVNNAGIFVNDPLEKTKEKDWDQTIETNLKGTYLFIKNIAEHMKKNKKGKIINVSSIAGKAGLINTSAFSSANGGIINLTKVLTLELSPYKININAISPGIIATGLMDSLIEDKKIKKSLLENIPMNRFGNPEEIADSAVFLASNDSDFITGHNLVVDGGWKTH